MNVQPGKRKRENKVKKVKQSIKQRNVKIQYKKMLCCSPASYNPGVFIGIVANNSNNQSFPTDWKLDKLKFLCGHVGVCWCCEWNVTNSLRGAGGEKVCLCHMKIWWARPCHVIKPQQRTTRTKTHPRPGLRPKPVFSCWKNSYRWHSGKASDGDNKASD